MPYIFIVDGVIPLKPYEWLIPIKPQLIPLKSMLLLVEFPLNPIKSQKVL